MQSEFNTFDNVHGHSDPKMLPTKIVNKMNDNKI